LGGENENDTEPKAEIKLIIKVGHDNRIEAIGGAGGYISHYEDKNVLLDVPWTRIKRELSAAKDAR